MTFFEHKRILITGGGRGIGAATAKKLAALGAEVTIVARTTTELSKTANEINRTSPLHPVTYVIADICEMNEIKELYTFIDKAKDTPLYGLVNAAGTIEVSDIESTSENIFQETYKTNVFGTYFVSKEALIRMKKCGGAIVNISSLAGIRGLEKFPGFSSYTVSKHAVVGITEAFAAEGAQFNIRTNCIAPGAVDTQMLKKAAPNLKTNAIPEDIAETICFLLNGKSSKQINGTTIEIFSNG
jgi:NAD(P)-dependent dehydrogenase (short-subunit alcohol dehydrogenase family)